MLLLRLLRLVSRPKLKSWALCLCSVALALAVGLNVAVNAPYSATCGCGLLREDLKIFGGSGVDSHIVLRHLNVFNNIFEYYLKL